MKFIHFSLVFLCLIFVTFSCENEEDETVAAPVEYSLPGGEEISSLLAKSHIDDGFSRKDPLASFVAEGSIEIFHGYDQEKDRPFLRIGLMEQTSEGIARTAVFEVKLDEAIEYPTLIPLGKIVYLQNQLALIDLDHNSATNFFVRDGIHDNAFSDLPMVDVQSLVLKRGKKAADQFMKSESCSCDCYRCLSPQNCGSETKSCTCGASGNSQSVTCRVSYEARCTTCNDNEY